MKQKDKKLLLKGLCKQFKLHNKYDVFKKVQRIFKSCCTFNELKNVRILISNFEILYNDSYLTQLLKDEYWDKRDKIIE